GMGEGVAAQAAELDALHEDDGLLCDGGSRKGQCAVAVGKRSIPLAGAGLEQDAELPGGDGRPAGRDGARLPVRAAAECGIPSAWTGGGLALGSQGGARAAEGRRREGAWQQQGAG